MASARLVGPDLPSGLRRPGRAVSLPSPELQRMGFDFDEFDRLITGGVSEAEQNPWDLVEDPVTGELVERTSTGYMPYLGGEDNWEGRYDQSLVGLSGAELDEEIAEMEEWVGEENTSIAQGYRDRALAEKARREGGQPAGAEGVTEDPLLRASISELRQLNASALTDRQLEAELRSLQSELGAASMQEGIEAASQRPALARLQALQAESARRSAEDRLDYETPRGTDWAQGPPGYDPAEWVTDEFGNRIDPDTGEVPPASVGGGNPMTRGLTADEAFQQHDDRAISGLSDAQRARLMRDPGGFTPPDISGLTRSGGLTPPDISELTKPGGYDIIPPMSNIIPGPEIMPPGQRGEQTLPHIPGRVPQGQGLTADQAFQQHHAMSGRADPNQGELPGTGGPREQIEGAREQLRPRTPEEQEAWEKASREKGHRRPPIATPPPVPPRVSPREDRNPELRSMDSQMLADMMAQQATQPEQGYFGGMGEAVQGLTNRVAGMSGQERAALIAALVAAGLLTAGSGGMLAPAGAALMGGAGMAALSQ